MAQKVLITGAASGLGKAMAMDFARRGATLCIADINEQAAQTVADDIVAEGGSAIAARCDITNDADVAALHTRLSAEWQGLDVLVNNAGVATAGALEFEDIEQWQWVMNINLLGLVRMTRAFVPMLSETGSGHIINIASQAGITPIPIMGSYNASKAAVVSFSETMHLELADKNIHVSVACPSFFNTNLDKSLRTKQPGVSSLVSKMLTRSSLDAADVARIIIEKSLARDFLILSHKDGRMAYRLKRFLPINRYLNTVKAKTRHFGKIRE